MTGQTSCLNEQELRRCLSRPLPADEADALARHAEECPRCGAALDRLLAGDPVTAVLRDRTSAQDQPPAAELIERLKGLGQLPLSLGGGQQTLPSQGQPQSQTTPGAPSGGVDEDDWSFLAPPEQPGEMGRLGHFRILAVLGRGGMGIVFRAEDTQMHRPAALKAMLPALAASQSARDRFLREARAAAAVRHDHVVSIFQVGKERGTPFLAMELLEGESLESRLRRQTRLPLAEVLRIGGEMAEGLAAAHDKELIHRDVKPDNVWLEAPRGRVKLLDFGLAKAVAEPGLTRSGCIIGTPGYVSPEQARGEAVDARTDLFSLGCVLYRMTTGRAPYQGADAISTLVAVVLEEPAPPQRHNAEVPQALSELIMRLLAKDPAKRPESARAVAEALSAIAGRRDEPAKPRRWLAWAVAAALLLALGAGGAWLGGIVSRGPKTDEGRQVGTGDDARHRKDGDRPADVRVLLDQLKRESIPQEALKAAGGGDATKAPAQLVAVLGKSRADGPRIYQVAFTADGRALIAIEGSRKRRSNVLTFWDTSTGERVREVDLGGAESTTALSADKKTLAYRGNKAIRLRALPSGKEIRTISTGDEWPLGLALDPKGAVVAGLFAPADVRLFDTTTGKEIGAILTGRTTLYKRSAVFAFNHAGSLLAAGMGTPGKPLAEVVVWDVKTRKEVKTLNVRVLLAVTFSPDGKLFAASGGLFDPVVLDASSWKRRYEFTSAALSGRPSVPGLDFSSDSKRLAAVSVREDNTGRLSVFDMATGNESTSVALPRARAVCVAFSPDDRHLAVGNWDGTIDVLRLAEPRDGPKRND